MVAPSHADAVNRLLAAVPERDVKGRMRFAELGFPTPRDEDWRFTPVKPITELDFTAAAMDHSASLKGCVFTEFDGPKLIFVNGHFSRDLSVISGLPEGVEIRNLSAGDCPALAEDEDAFNVLNAATYIDGPFIRVADNVKFEKPVVKTIFFYKNIF